MRKFLFSIRAFITYWLKKEDRFSQQSPFVFKIYSELLSFLKANQNGDFEIEKFRESLLGNRSKVTVLDLGAGSRKIPLPQRHISQITRYSTSGIKFSQVYQFFCNLTPGGYVIELGTCVGISTRYLDKCTKGRLFTFEGSEEIQRIAKQDPVPQKTEFILGPISQTLAKVLETTPTVDFALIDANHTYMGTMQSFYSLIQKINSRSILAIGDIHWTPEMEKAWEEIKLCPQVKLTLDFFECGIVFFDYPGEKTHLILDI